MNSWDINQIIDGVLHASPMTYLIAFLSVAALFVFGYAVSVWLAPKNDSADDALQWPDSSLQTKSQKPHSDAENGQK
jgi:hypothetical protein